MATEVTTVADDVAVLHVDGTAHRFDDLSPDTSYTFMGEQVHTLARPSGELLCRFATVNDVHFGEVECGRIDDHPMGPILRLPPDAEPYPEVMNRGAIAEIGAIDPAAVIVKGDLTADGDSTEFAAFEARYGVFGDRLHVVRGNHDSYHGQAARAGDSTVDLPGVRLLLLDTTIPFETTGRVTPAQIGWLDAACAEADRPVMIFGHHQNWVPGKNREPGYFGINPEDSEALIGVVAKHAHVLGYFAGHTHRNRVRHVDESGDAVYVEVACVKDFPGSWAEYRVYEGGVMQVHHRISTPDALAWSEQCRQLYRDFGVDYVSYALGSLAERCFVMTPRRAAARAA
jgi:3',5'-cyclic-AMP phosphodiesterase